MSDPPEERDDAGPSRSPTTPRVASSSITKNVTIATSSAAPCATSAMINSNGSAADTPDVILERRIPIYVRFVPRDIWLRMHVDLASTISAVKDAALERAGVPFEDPTMNPGFFEEVTNASALASMSKSGLGLPPEVSTLPRGFLARRPGFIGSGNNGGPTLALWDSSVPISSPRHKTKAASTASAAAQHLHGDPGRGGIGKLGPVGAGFPTAYSLPTLSNRRQQATGPSAVSPGIHDATSDGELLSIAASPLAASASVSPGLNVRPSRRPAMPSSASSPDIETRSHIRQVTNRSARHMTSFSALAAAAATSSPSPTSTRQAPTSSDTHSYAAASQAATPYSLSSAPGSPSVVVSRRQAFKKETSHHSQDLSLTADLDAYTDWTTYGLPGNSEALRLEQEATARTRSPAPGADVARKSGALSAGSSSATSTAVSRAAAYTAAATGMSPSMSSSTAASADIGSFGITSPDDELSTSASTAPEPDVITEAAEAELSKDGAREQTPNAQSKAWQGGSQPGRRDRKPASTTHPFDSDEYEESTSEEESVWGDIGDEADQSGHMTSAGRSSLSTSSEDSENESALRTIDDSQLWGTQLEELMEQNAAAAAAAAAAAQPSAVGTPAATGQPTRSSPAHARQASILPGGVANALAAQSQPRIPRREGSVSSERARSGTITVSNMPVQSPAGTSAPAPATTPVCSESEVVNHLAPSVDRLARKPPAIRRVELDDAEIHSKSSESSLGSNTQSLSRDGVNYSQLSTSTHASSPAKSVPRPSGRIAGIRMDEISAWDQATHPMSPHYALYSFTNGMLMEDWRTVAAFKVRPFELIEVQFARQRDRVHLPRMGEANLAVTSSQAAATASALAAASARMRIKTPALDERYVEPFSEGWYYVLKSSSGSGKHSKAGLGTWKLRYVVVRGWILSLFRQKPSRPDLSVSRGIFSWHLGTTRWVVTERADGATSPPLRFGRLASESISIKFNTGVATNYSQDDGELAHRNLLTLRALTEHDHEALFSIIARAYYRHVTNSADPGEGLNIEAWRRRAIARATIAGRGGTVQPGRAGRRAGRNALARARLRPKGMSRAFDDADRWSSTSESEVFTPPPSLVNASDGNEAAPAPSTAPRSASNLPSTHMPSFPSNFKGKQKMESPPEAPSSASERKASSALKLSEPAFLSSSPAEQSAKSRREREVSSAQSDGSQLLFAAKFPSTPSKVTADGTESSPNRAAIDGANAAEQQWDSRGSPLTSHRFLTEVGKSPERTKRSWRISAQGQPTPRLADQPKSSSIRFDARPPAFEAPVRLTLTPYAISASRPSSRSGRTRAHTVATGQDGRPASQGGRDTYLDGSASHLLGGGHESALAGMHHADWSPSHSSTFRPSTPTSATRLPDILDGSLTGLTGQGIPRPAADAGSVKSLIHKTDHS
ncbi:hypothetical protein CBOM_02171 [Ceraceosorus bombacis]|uniref:PH domain-containing protein n=1 Tax=Ceraceosorus bombacis TaxID=401625 RepID=A0A0N7L9N9_9BASI|nr:hypothetical protein CBOM_02171 [Ceraceosorus bombacis]